ncbi:MAG: SDR family oxidoreductase [Candidatus Gracilibacteria bacterium]|jgi:NAD(P)-dependent dehydrogenase (short-subunit alcohol dehydrogenase family)
MAEAQAPALTTPEASTEQRRVIVVTGKVGICRAVMDDIAARAGKETTIVCVSKHKPTEEEKAALPQNFEHIVADLTNGGIEHATNEIARICARTQAQVETVLYGAGELELDTEIGDAPLEDRDMHKLSMSAAELTRALHGRNILKNGARIGYISSLSAHKDPKDPGAPLEGVMRKYCEAKRAGLKALKDLKDELESANPPLRINITEIEPGAFNTGMLGQYYGETGIPLEWFAVRPQEPDSQGNIAELIAAWATGEIETDYISAPLISWLFITQLPRISKKLQKFLLGVFIQLNGKSIAEFMWKEKKQAEGEGTNLTAEKVEKMARWWNSNMDFHKKQKSYGPDFPYDRLCYGNLAPTWAGNAINAVCKSLDWIELMKFGLKLRGLWLKFRSLKTTSSPEQ